MRKILDFPNHESTSSDFPYGNVKDNSGANDGTPVNKLVFSDIFQFFNRLAALASVVANGLPENVTNSFQMITALQTYIGAFITTAVNAEASTRSTADSTLQTNINTEITNRTNAVSSEASARTAADALKSDKAKGAWINLSLGANWSNGGINTPRYRVTDQNNIEFAGIVQVGGVPTTTLCTISIAIIASSHDINKPIINVTDSTVAKLNLSGGASLQVSIVQAGGLVTGKEYDLSSIIAIDSDN